MPGSAEQNFDNSAEIVSHRVAGELDRFQGQVISPALIEAVRQRIAENIGGLVGAAEVSDILGISRQRVSQLNVQSPARMPMPSRIAYLSATPLWFKADIEDFKIRRGTYPKTNPPHKASPESEPLTSTADLPHPQYLIEDITSPDSIVVREHFTNLGKSHTIPNGTFTRAFHTLVDQRKANAQNRSLFELGYNPVTHRNWKQVREPVPPPGIVLVRRSEVGIEPYGETITDINTTILAGYGIKAGSIVEALGWLVGADTYEKQSSKTMRVLGVLVTQLSEQIA